MLDIKVLEVGSGKTPAHHKVPEESTDKLFKVIAVGTSMTDVYNAEAVSLFLPQKAIEQAEEEASYWAVKPCFPGLILQENMSLKGCKRQKPVSLLS